MRWQSVLPGADASCAITPGSASKPALAADQRVERRSASIDSASRIRRAVSQRARWVCRDAADLRRLQRQPPRVKPLAERHRHRLIAVPAHLDDRGFEARRGQRQREAGRRPRSRESPGRLRPRAEAGSAKRTPSARAVSARCGLRSTSSTSQPAMRPAIHAARQPTAPAPITVTRSPTCGRASHRPLIAVSRFAASTARGGGTWSGITVTGARGHDVARLMRIEREHVAPPQGGGAALDDPDAGVAVLHRRGKRAGLKRRAHALVLARRHASLKHQRFGAAADAAEQRAHDDLVRRRRRQRLAANLAAPGLGHPEGARLV